MIMLINSNIYDENQKQLEKMIVALCKENRQYKRENFRTLGNQIIGISPFFTTWGLMYGVERFGYNGRFCYKAFTDCYDAFHSVTILGHEYPPLDTNWIVQKGHPNGDRQNIFKTGKLGIEL